MNNIKRSIVLFVSSLLMTTLCFSQTIYPKLTKDSLIVITPAQLKQTNLVFLEHEHLQSKYALLEQQCNVQDSINIVLSQVQSNQNEIIDSLNLYNQQYEKNLVKMSKTNKKLKKLNKGLTSFSIGSLLLILLLL